MYFLQCALLDFFSFAWKFVCNLLTQFTMFSIFKGTDPRNRCTFKKIYNPIFSFFTVRPVRLIYLYTKIWFLPTHKVKIFFSFCIGTNQRKSCNLKNNIKAHVFIFYSAPCQIVLYLHQSLCYTYSHSLKCFPLPKVHIIEIGALTKII